MPTQMTNGGSNFPNGNFIPEIWTKQLNLKFYPKTILQLVTNTRWQAEVLNFGGSVKIRVRPTVLVEDDWIDKPITYQDAQDDMITLDIKYSKRFSFKRDDIQKAQQDIDTFEELTNDSAYQMKTAIERHVFSTVYSDASNTVTQLALDKTNVEDWAIDGDVKLYENNAPEEERFIIVSPKIGGLMQKSDLKKANWTGDAMSIMRDKMGTAEGTMLGNVGALKVYVSNNLTTTTDGVTHCLAGQKEAVTFASQFEKVESLRLQEVFGEAVRGRNVYGFKTVQPGLLVHMPVTLA